MTKELRLKDLNKRLEREWKKPLAERNIVLINKLGNQQVKLTQKVREERSKP
ncbi:MAG: hypothetical protein ACRCYY_17590 [Trueperaceae bacterium]